jgi:hypothetical protein
MRKDSVCVRERARVIPSFKSWVCCSVLKRLIHRLDGESDDVDEIDRALFDLSLESL